MSGTEDSVTEEGREWRAPHVAVRLAGGGDFDNVTAGKPGCYNDVGGQLNRAYPAFYALLQSSAFQISLAYSRMVLSEENQPMRAVFSTAERHHSFESCHRASTLACAAQ